VMGFNMMNGRRAEEVHDRAYELACRRLDESGLV